MTAAANLRKIAAGVEDLPRSGLIASAKAVKEIARKEGGSMQVWRKRSRSRRTVRLRATDRIKERGDTALARIQGQPVGLWAIKDGGAGGHYIPKQRKRKKPPVLAFGGKVVTGPVRHPGMRGDQRWQRKVVKRAEKIVPAIFDDAIKEVIR